MYAHWYVGDEWLLGHSKKIPRAFLLKIHTDDRRVKIFRIF